MVTNLPAIQETQVQSLGQEDPLEEGMATHSSILAWRIPWTEEPGGLQSIGSQRVGHDRVQMHARVSGGVLILRSFSVLASGGFVAALPMISNSSNLPFGAQRRSWMLAYKKWGTKMPPCPGASQGPAWFH